MIKHVTVCAPFRDNNPLGLAAFVASIATLNWYPDALRFIFVEGDSVDHTREFLEAWAKVDSRVTLLTCTTGRPRYGNVVDLDRFEALAKVFNTALDAVDPIWSDAVLFTPSDVQFKQDTLARLVARQVDIVAPFYWGPDGLFYDTWGFVHNCRPFTKFPYTEVKERYGSELVPMDAVGGMVLIDQEVLSMGIRYSAFDVDRGLCRDAVAAGYSIWADPTTHVSHT